MMDWDGYLLAEEIILEILARLPIKSLFRAKCVCKLWYRLASHRSFTNLYNQLSLTNAMMLLSHSESSSSTILVDSKRGVSDVSLGFIKDRVRIRASCNGLLCCSSVPDRGVYYVCNPITRDCRLLPRTRGERPLTRFYPDGDPTLVALSSDLSTNTYSVVLAGYHRMFGHRPQAAKLVCSVYDSHSNKWRKFSSHDQQVQDHAFTHMNRNQAVFLNGSLHWMTQSFAYILVLDLNMDSWRRILLPHEMGCSGNRVYLLEFDGKLSVIQISSVWMNIWVLQKEEEEGQWDMIDRVSLRCIRGLVPGIFPISQGLDYVFLAGHKQVLLYQRKTRSWKEMYSVKNNNSSTMPLWFSAHSFRATIFSCR